MATVRFKLTDEQNLEGKLKRLSNVRFEKVARESAQRMYNRAPDMTPFRTGQLRGSLGVSGDTVGYTKSYAPFVEFGHRTRGGHGYVPGQHFLQKNVNIEGPIFLEAIKAELEKA